jgi:phenylalanyl-tRNA synthetase beta chain
VKVSLEWVSDYVELPEGVPPAELARNLTLKTVEVEEVIDPGAALEHVVTGVIEAVEPLGHSDRTALTCRISDDRVVTLVSALRGLAPGKRVAVALCGARLQTGRGELEPVSDVTISGRLSEGVICTPAQLGLQRLFGHADPAQAMDLAETHAAPGIPLAEAIGYRDSVLEIDNKSLTNRPDLWGHYGIAREFAAIYDLSLRPLEAAEPAAAAPTSGTAGLVGDLDSAVCQRFSIVEFSTQAGSAPSPLWLRSRLARIDQASIGLSVDLSNYVMFTTGQPTHIYDADKVTYPISARAALEPGTLELLDGTPVDLAAGMPIIVDAAGPIALAGVMGGANSVVDEGTRRYLLEAATFRPRPVRLSSQRVGLRTEASARFEKALDTQRVDVAIGLFWHLLCRSAPDTVASASQDVVTDATQPAEVTVSFRFLARRIGTAIDDKEIGQTLHALGFLLHGEEDALFITAPTWRSTGDISLPEDIVEEVARVHGYDNLTAADLSITLRPSRSLSARPTERVVRETLAARAGMREVITYPWVSDAMLAATGLRKDETVRFDGAPSPDQDSLRPSLMPNLVEAAARNLHNLAQVAIFEVGTVFLAEAWVPYGDGFEPMPPQHRMLAGIRTGNEGAVLFRQTKGILEQLSLDGQLTAIEFLEVSPGTDVSLAPWADASARVAITAYGVVIGTLGLLTRRVRRLSGLSAAQAACFELDLGSLKPHLSRQNVFEPLPELPEAEFDLSVVVADATPWTRIAAIAAKADPLVHQVTFGGEFRGSWVPGGHRSLTLHITLRPVGATLTSDTIGASRSRVIAALADQADAHLRA